MYKINGWKYLHSLKFPYWHLIQLNVHGAGAEYSSMHRTNNYKLTADTDNHLGGLYTRSDLLRG